MFFFLSSGRKEELQRSNIAAKGRCATLMRWPSLSRFQWNESLQFKRLLTIQGTVLVQCVLSCVRRLWRLVFQFGREKGEHETQETGYEAQGTTERRKKGAEMPAFLWTTAFLFPMIVTNEPLKTANRAWMTTPLRSTSFYTITTIAFNVSI